MSYTKRTCHKCGYRDIQPNMVQKKIKIETGSSEAALSKRSYIQATFFNDKKAGNQVSNWATGNTKRKYTRNRVVWMCQECSEPSWYRTGGVLHTLDVWLWKVFKVVAIWGALVLFVNFMDTWSKT